jgi:urease accessory protein
VTGSLWATPATATNVTELRELAGPAVRAGISRIGDVLVCRALAADAEPLKAFFERAWAALRPAMLDRPACPPRIWRT